MRGKTEIVFLAAILGIGFLFKDEAVAAVTSNGDWFTRWDSLIKQKAKKYSLPWRWIKAIAMNESMLGTAKSVARGLAAPTDVEGSKSSDGKSWGIMQLTLPTARDMVGALIQPAYLNDPENSFELGARYLRKMYDLGKGDREFMVRAYNGGPGYKNTVLGQTMTPVYYAKFVTNLNTILSKQPGNEMEY